jgi:hypothetical protein
LGPGTQRLLTRTTLVNSDRYYQDRFKAFKENFAPASTAILASSWHRVEYYLPEYVRLPFGVVSKWEQGEGNPVGNPQGDVVLMPSDLLSQPDIEGEVVVVVFDPALARFNKTPGLTKKLDLEHGDTLAYFVLEQGQAFYYGTLVFGVVP